MHRVVVIGLAALAACSGKKEAEPSTQPAAVGELVRTDAGITAVVTEVDSTERHLDEDGFDRPSQYGQPPARPGRPIDITLRSSPPGAQVAVDGLVLGTTPEFWSGMADGREHEFVFTMRGYAIARYRFVPVASGVIHGRLDPIHEEPNAGVPPPEVVPPRGPSPSVTPPTSSVTPPSAPPSAPSTIVTPEPPVAVPAPTPPPESGGSSGSGVSPQP